MSAYAPPPPSVSTPDLPAPLPPAEPKSHRGAKIAAGAVALVLVAGVAGAAGYELNRVESAQNQVSQSQSAQTDTSQEQSSGFGSTAYTYPIAGSTATATGGAADAIAYCWQDSGYYTYPNCQAAYQYWTSSSDTQEAGWFAAVVEGTGLQSDYLDQVHANRNYDSANSDAAYLIAGAGACMYQAQGYSKEAAAMAASQDVSAISSDPAYAYIGEVAYEAFIASNYDCANN